MLQGDDGNNKNNNVNIHKRLPISNEALKPHKYQIDDSKTS
jgi:hypothetical protein